MKLETPSLLITWQLELPCILISAALDGQIEAEAKAANAFSVMSKPVRLPDITGMVARAMLQVYCWQAPSR
jgi:DNA-binding NtrC family response regulator